MSIDMDRASFEAYFLANHSIKGAANPLSKSDAGIYLYTYADAAWDIWQTSRISLDAEDRGIWLDAKRFRWIEENCKTNGGGRGFTVFVPVDHEDIGCGIDVAMAKARQA